MAANQKKEKQFALRLPEELFDSIEQLADNNQRSVNTEMLNLMEGAISAMNGRLYAAGPRIKQVREDIGVRNSSEFIDLIGFRGSEKSYQRLEIGEDECDISLLERVNNLTGADMEWLKHGDKNSYTAHYEAGILNIGSYTLTASNVVEEVEKLIQQRFQNIYVVMDMENYDVGLVVVTNERKFGDYERVRRYAVLDLTMITDFWGPVNDCSERHALKFYDILRLLDNKFSGFYGRILNRDKFVDLFAGSVYPSQVLEDRQMMAHPHQYWPVDLLRGGLDDEEAASCYGDWFVESRKYYKLIRKSSNLGE